MQSERKWEKRRTQRVRSRDSDYTEDDTTGMARENSSLKRTLIASAIGIAGIAAYRSGLLKGGIKELLRYADDFQGYGDTTMQTMRRWSKNNTEAPKASLLRMEPTKANLKRMTNPRNFNEMMSETRRDIKNLNKEVISKNKKLSEAAKDVTLHTYSDTDLGYEMGRMKSTLDGLNKAGVAQARKPVQSQLMQDVSRKMTQAAEEGQKKMKRSGYRSATLEDLIHVAKNGGVQSRTDRIRLDDKDGTLDRINQFINTAYTTEEGVTETLLSSNKYKNIVLDKNIMVDEFGEFIDVRKADKAKNNLVHSLATDFKIPAVGINPLRLFDVDQMNRTKLSSGLLHANTYQPHVTKLAGRTDSKIKDVFGDKPLLFSDGNVFRINDDMGGLEKVGSNYHVWKIPKEKQGPYGLPREVDQMRKMANLNLVDYEHHDEKSKTYQRLYGKMMETLDLGFQDKAVEHLYQQETGLADIFKPDHYIEEMGRKLGKTNMFHASKSVTSQHDLSGAFGNAPEGEDLIVAFRDSHNLRDAFKEDKGYDLKDWAHQFVAGRKKVEGGPDTIGDNVTSRTSLPYFMFDRMDQAIGMFGLGMSNESKASVGHIAANLVLKRFLPVYGAYQGYQYLNYLTEGGDEDENGSPDNITMRTARNVKNFDLGWHRVKDSLGITKVAKEIADLTPGSEQIADIPGINVVDWTSTTEEREEYYESGMTEVRKGRYWDMGNTPLTGGKIQYFQPNLYRRIMGDAEFSDSKFGSREEYFKNAWFPTLTQPLAPIRHFVTDKYYYDRKHYNDRPYLMTSPEGENIPVIGPAFGATIGRILKPRLRMHEEYWQKGGATSYTEPLVDPSLQAAIPGQQGSAPSTEGGEEAAAQVSSGGSPSRAMPDDAAVAGDLLTPKLQELGVDIGTTAGARPKDESYEVYQTPSGGMQVINIDNSLGLSEVNFDLRKYALSKAVSADTRVDTTPPVTPEPTIGDVASPNSVGHSLSEQANQWGDIAGIYGFAIQGFVTGEAQAEKEVIDTPGWSMSFNRQFWDQNAGGLGGEFSEIFRRFLPKRRNDVAYINPIKNTMPEWMPGEDYFTNFQTGDPYTKVAKGEMRLPGEGYERTWNIKDPTALRVGSSTLGKEPEEIIKHLLNQDPITDEGLQSIVDEGTEYHKKIEDMWLKSGLALDTEGKIEDEENGVLGFYDAVIHDESSRTKIGVVDIKTISDKGFREVLKTGEARADHHKQVNYYMWALGQEKGNGYVQYINRDDPNQTYTAKFKYSDDLLQESLNNLRTARDYIRNGIADGSIGRGELYDPIDRLRILGDVAPYSREYAETKAMLSKMKITTEEQEEVSAIDNRVTEAKEPMRIYPYRFKTANLEMKTVTVKKMLSNNTFIANEMPDNPIKLAGVHVSEAMADGTGEEASKQLAQLLKPGRSVRIGYDMDEANQVTKDTVNSIRAVVYSNGLNVNKTMVKRGLATEKEDDFTPASIHARYNPMEIAFGKAWEAVSHLNTPFHTKVLQVRSAAESYEQREVYGKDFQNWTHPVRDFLIPAIRESINRPSGLIWGTLLGSAFGSTRYGKILGALTGFSVTAIGKAIVGTKEATTGERWIPETRQKERNLNEYIDTLKYVKYRGLYEEYAQKTLKEEGFDVKAFMKSAEFNGQDKKARKRDLMDFKKFIKMNYADRDQFEFKTGAPKYVDMQASQSLIVGQINKELTEIQSDRSVTRLSSDATKAIDYYNKSEKTMYGYDRGDPLANILAALPKTDRQYMKYFMKAPEEEKGKILSLAPKYLRRALESTWGMPVEDKPSLDAYFQENVLPDAEWEGWNEETDLDSVKIKMIKQQGLDFGEFDVWQDQIDQANAEGEIPLPKMNVRSNALTVRNKLMDVLTEMGLEDIEVDYRYSTRDVGVDVKMKKDKRQEIEEKIRTSKLV